LILLSSLRAACQVIASCIRNHVSSVLPEAFVSRIAISGLEPELPFTTLVKSLRVTKNLLPGGHGQAQRLKAIMPDDAPGCTGVFMGMSMLRYREIDRWPVRGSAANRRRDSASALSGCRAARRGGSPRFGCVDRLACCQV